MINPAYLNNPFTVTTPEDMDAEDAHHLFVNVYSDFPKLLDVGHTFLHGPRGCGKSMMFRYLKPDCQKIEHSCCIDKLPFYSIYVRIKYGGFHVTEMQRLEGKHAAFILNEHFMVMHLAQIIFESLGNENCIDDNDIVNLDSINTYYQDIFLHSLKSSGYLIEQHLNTQFSSVSDAFNKMFGICEELYNQARNYLNKLSFHSQIIPYEDSLCSYFSFLLPVIKGMRSLSFMPKGPIFLLLDDADKLSETQTKILNSWVFTRSSSEVSLKISTQFGYKTYQTVSGEEIETPHDYSEINISTVYTASKKDRYIDRVHKIIKKRLALGKVDSTPEEFFPEDEEQEAKIREISEQLKEKWNTGEGRGYRASDDVVRYARPDFIKSLGGSSKSTSTYSYAGFKQLVHLSSGIVRYFLDSAKEMYHEASTGKEQGDIKFIPPSIQNKVVRKKADEFIFDELVKKKDDQSLSIEDEKITKLSNLLIGLGGLFRLCLLSDRAERKVFSFALSNEPPENLDEILKLGIKYGYLQKSTIGKKSSMTAGRTNLFVLSRRLAPLNNLDPTGFAGYLFMTSDFLSQALKNPDALLSRIKKKEDFTKELNTPTQLKLFQ